MVPGDEGRLRAEAWVGNTGRVPYCWPSWHRGKAWSDDTSQLGPDKHARDVPSLDKYAEERWEVRTWDSVGVSACVPVSHSL